MQEETTQEQEIQNDSPAVSTDHNIDDCYLLLEDIYETLNAEESTETVDYSPYLQSCDTHLKNLENTMLFCLVCLGLIFGIVGAQIFSQFWKGR